MVHFHDCWDGQSRDPSPHPPHACHFGVPVARGVRLLIQGACVSTARRNTHSWAVPTLTWLSQQQVSANWLAARGSERIKATASQHPELDMQGGLRAIEVKIG